MPVQLAKLRSMVPGQFWKNSLALFKLAYPGRRSVLALYFGAMILGAMLPFAESALWGASMNEIVATIGAGTWTGALVLCFAAVCAVRLFQAVLAALQEHVAWKADFLLTEVFELLMIRHRGRVDAAQWEQKGGADLFTRVMEGGPYRMVQFVRGFFDLSVSVISVIIALAVIGISYWYLGLFVALLTIPAFVNDLRYGDRVWNIYCAKAESRRKFFYARTNFFTVDSLKELQLFRNVRYFLELIRALFTEIRSEEEGNERKKLKWQCVCIVIAQLGILGATAFFVHQVVAGRLSIGGLTFLLMSMATFRSSLSGVSYNTAKLMRDNKFVTDFVALSTLEPLVRGPEKGIVIPRGASPVIEFRDVSFQYPQGNEIVLRNFSLTLRAGEVLAVVGPNGVGKTTLVNLLARIYDPTSGVILVNGHDLRDLDLDSWRDLLGVLSQHYSVYDFLRIKEVIALGRTSEPLDMDKVREAAKASGADEFIERWEDSYDRMQGTDFGGTKLSGGQYQRIALSRVHYRDAEVVVLDEPTASVDPLAERRIFEDLRTMRKGRTTVLITHRISNARTADRICVIEGGQVTELGTHEELMDRRGSYATLFEAQAIGYRE